MLHEVGGFLLRSVFVDVEEPGVLGLGLLEGDGKPLFLGRQTLAGAVGGNRAGEGGIDAESKAIGSTKLGRVDPGKG